MIRPCTPAKQAVWRSAQRAVAGAAGALMLAGCTTTTPPAKVYPLPQASAPNTQVLPMLPAPPTHAAAQRPPPHASAAVSARAYRVDGARYLYRRYADQVFQGPLPPLLQAVGVLRARIGRSGEVLNLEWMRAPTHAPEVMQAIERMVREAQPFPAPWQLGGVVYTETWLWHASGRFQLDTLTEGQR